jgi:recombination associated protein RdgC
MCSRPEFTPIDGASQMSIGFSEPNGIAGIETVTIERKTVPADVLKRRVDALALDIEQQTGRKPGKKHRAELKEQALGTLLLNAFPKRKTVSLLWLGDDTLLVGSASSADTDAIVTLLVANESGLEVSPVQTERSPGAVMTHWVAATDDDAVPYAFNLGRSVTLESGDGEKVGFKDHPLHINTVTAHTRDKTVTSIALVSERDVTFTLHDSLQVSGIKLGGVVPDEGHADAATAECHLWAGELRSLWDDIVGEFHAA